MKTEQLLIKIRKFFLKKTAVSSAETGLFSEISRMALQSQILIRAFYGFNLFISIVEFRNWFLFRNAIIANPAWPLFWINAPLSAEYLVKFFYVLNFLTAIVALIFYRQRWVRIFSFVSLFFLTACYSSDLAGWPRISQSVGYVTLAFLFIFLPNENSSRSREKNWNTLFIIYLCQIYILLGYASAGIWRFRNSFVDYLDGANSILDWGAMVTVIKFLSYTYHGATSPVGDFIISQPLLNGPSILIATLFEFSALYVVFRPRLYAYYGYLAMLLHAGFALIFNITFFENVILAIIFLVCAPVLKTSHISKKVNNELKP